MDKNAKILQYVSDASNSEFLTNLRSEARYNRSFFYGDQWTDEEKQYYKSLKITPVTVNRIKPIIKTSVGIYLQNQQDIKIIANQGANEYSVAAWNAIFKDAEQKMSSQKKYTRWFAAGLVDKVSYVKYETDFLKTPNGQPMLRLLSVFDVDYDPSGRSYDLNEDCRYVIEKQWMDKDVVAMMYPEVDVAESVSSSAKEASEYGQASVDALLDWSVGNNGNSIKSENENSTDFDSTEVDTVLLTQGKIVVRTVWWKEVVPGYLVKNDNEEQAFTKDKKVAIKLKKEKGYSFKKVPYFILHKAIVINNKVVDDEIDPFGDDMSDFPIFRFSPLFYNGKPIGMVDNLPSLNREENVSRTQLLVYLSATNNSGYKVGGGSEQAKKELAENATKDNVVVDISKYRNIVERITPNPYPTGLAMNANEFDRNIKAVSGISDSAMGGDNSEESGRAIYLRTQQNRTQFQDILDNFFNSLEALGTFLFEYIFSGNVYTEQEIRQIVKESDVIDPEFMAIARRKLMKFTGGIDVPEPSAPPPPDPQMMDMIRPEDKMSVMNTIKQGSEAAMEYARQYPRLKKSFDATVKQMGIEMLIKDMKSDELKNYGIDVNVSPHAPSESMAIFAQMMDINNSLGGGVFPPDMLVDASILPPNTKASLKNRLGGIQQQQGLQANMEANNTGNIVDQMKKTEQL